MAEVGEPFRVLKLLLYFLLAIALVSAETSTKHEASTLGGKEELSSMSNYFPKAFDFKWQPNQSYSQHVWPMMKLGSPIIIGTIIGSFGAAFGTAGGVGGGSIFVPMLRLVIGFDPKSAVAMSKCMIMGAAVSTVYFNLKQRHPVLDIPIIDYDLVLLIQPMLMLGISLGVAFSVVFADWMITILVIILFLGTAIKAFLKGIETWNKETMMKRVSILENVYWKELGLLVFVWVSFLVLQIGKNYTATCSWAYWVLNLLQIPVSVGVYAYEAAGLYKGKKEIASRGLDQPRINWRIQKLFLLAAGGLLAGTIAGLLGIGGGFVMGPLFLELGVPPQVSSATATFGMTFSSSMSVIEYYLLNRFPVPYALYFTAVAAIAAYAGQTLMHWLIQKSGRASLIIFVLAFIVLLSTLSMGGSGIANMIGMIQRHEYMGFEDLC
ncbi:hypothetical protein UlMin_035021 [Ulmus minor]